MLNHTINGLPIISCHSYDKPWGLKRCLCHNKFPLKKIECPKSKLKKDESHRGKDKEISILMILIFRH